MLKNQEFGFVNINPETLVSYISADRMIVATYDQVNKEIESILK